MIAEYVTNTYEIADRYKAIRLNAKEAKVKIEPSNDDKTTLVFFEKKRWPYEFFVQDNTLTIKQKKVKWFNFSINHSQIRLCVPKAMLETISVRLNTGHIDICAIVCDATIDIQTTTGKVDASNISCKDFRLKANTGNANLEKLTAADSVCIENNTGNVVLNDCSAPAIFVKTNTGNVCGRLSADVVFAVNTNTGRAETPQPTVGERIGGRCEIKTNTGNILFE